MSLNKTLNPLLITGSTRKTHPNMTEQEEMKVLKCSPYLLNNVKMTTSEEYLFV